MNSIDSIIQAILAVPIYLIKQLYKMSVLNKYYPIDEQKQQSDIKHTIDETRANEHSQHVINNDSILSILHNTTTMNNLGWHKSFANDTVDIGLRFHYPNKQAELQYQADRFLIFIRAKGMYMDTLIIDYMTCLTNIQVAYSDIVIFYFMICYT